MTLPTGPRVASCAEAGDAVHTAVPSDEAPAASTTPPSNDAWRVLQSGALAYRMPPADDGGEVWLDAQLRVKLCEHGHSAAQIAHWNCTTRPRPRPEWTACDCTSMCGLCMNPRKPRPELPDVVPEYHRVLWRDHEPVLLEPVGVLAVRVPGNPKGQEVYLDAEGTARCPHGLTAGSIALREERKRRHARGAKPRPPRAGSAADVGCCCSAKGLRLERFGTTHRHWASAVRQKEERSRRIQQQREERRLQHQSTQCQARDTSNGTTHRAADCT
jgi:hypothetical protein